MAESVSDLRPGRFAEIGNVRLHKEVSTLKLFSVHESVIYYLYHRPMKISKSFNRLAVLIRTEVNSDITNGDVFLFLNRNCKMIEVLIYEKKGFSIFYHR